MAQLSGGAIIAEVLREYGVPHLFTLCGGHISPILVEANARGIRVVDMRDEKSAVFAADAVSRMTGIPGVAAVTAGPGVTNCITAVKNAQLAQSPLIVFGGATATILKGRGSLQDIDQLSLMAPITKWASSLRTRSAIRPALERAFAVARSGVPGPVFLEVPIDLLYPADLVRTWYLRDAGVDKAEDAGSRLLKLYLEGHLFRQFHAPALPRPHLSRPEPRTAQELLAAFPPPRRNPGPQVRAVAQRLARAERPLLVVGSQALVNCRDPAPIADAIQALGIPTFLGGSARGLLGRTHRLQLRHHRTRALKEADLVIIAGFPFDFRLGYGRHISRQATLVSANLSAIDLRKNRRPEVAVRMNPGEFLLALASTATARERSGWLQTLRERDDARDTEISGSARPSAPGGIDPIHLLLRLEATLADDAILVVDGGDFVATASYILRPRGPLGWLDPGAFGTLGVGGGFAAGAALCHPGREVWLLYGDGSSAYSLAEFDTYVRHGLAPIALVGTDASWAQIAREQVELLHDDVGTTLRHTDYHRVAEGYGGEGLLLTEAAQIDATLARAQALARSGRPVCINAQLAPSDFRKGSISM